MFGLFYHVLVYVMFIWFLYLYILFSDFYLIIVFNLTSGLLLQSSYTNLLYWIFNYTLILVNLESPFQRGFVPEQHKLVYDTIHYRQLSGTDIVVLIPMMYHAKEIFASSYFVKIFYYKFGTTYNWCKGL